MKALPYGEYRHLNVQIGAEPAFAGRHCNNSKYVKHLSKWSGCKDKQKKGFWLPNTEN